MMSVCGTLTVLYAIAHDSCLFDLVGRLRANLSHDIPVSPVASHGASQSRDDQSARNEGLHMLTADTATC